MNGRVLVWPLVLVLGIALVGQSVRWRDRLIASRILNTVEKLTVPAYRAQRTDLLQTNVELLRRAQERDPLEVGIPIARGSQHFLLRQSAAAIGAYEEALRLEPRPETYLYLGRALDSAGRFDEAGRAFRLAVRIDPRLLPQVPLAYRDRPRTE
jgi:tetratricopeptide (TPR) repeat protein